jgi:hypothetical protein
LLCIKFSKIFEAHKQGLKLSALTKYISRDVSLEGLIDCFINFDILHQKINFIFNFQAEQNLVYRVVRLCSMRLNSFVASKSMAKTE